ncbi:MAG: CotH kinase family protein [Bacteroidota bacterium]
MNKCLLYFSFLAVGLFYSEGFGQVFESNLPIIKITTTAIIVDEPKVEGLMEIINNEGKLNKSSDTTGLKYKIGVEYRGSTSQSLTPKKPLGIETRNEKGDNLNVSLLGLPADNDWVIITPYSDKTLIRDHLSYTFARQMNRYASRTKFVELILNGRYYGVCFLGEKIKQGKERVNISKLKATDIAGDDLTGGYILKIDKTSGSKSRSWNSAYLAPLKPPTFQIEYPKLEDIKEEQFNYIRKYVNDFESRLQSNDFKDPEKGYAKVADIDSFVDFFLVNELTRNVDGYRLSTFFYKDKDSKNGKLTMGPVWDFNLAFGNANYCEGWNISGWAYRFNEVCPNDPANGVPFWWEKLLRDESFQAKLKKRWKELRNGSLSNENIFFQFDSSTNLLEEAQLRNFNEWPILGRYVWPNNYVGITYNDEISYAKKWITDRLVWMDASAVLNSDLLAEEAIKVDIEKPFIYPNPMASQSKISFGTTKKQFVEATIKDISGKTVYTILKQYLDIGAFEFTFERNNLPSGMYFFSLEKDHKTAYYQKIILN